MTKLSKSAYWEKIVDYYYDNIHWAEPGPPSIYQWLKRDFNADCSLHSTCLRFDNPKDVTWFKLRWS